MSGATPRFEYTTTIADYLGGYKAHRTLVLKTLLEKIGE